MASDFDYTDHIRICKIPGQMICNDIHAGRCSVCDVAKKFEDLYN